MPKIGLNVRSSPSTSYKKLGALVCGTVVEVSAIENGWATIQHNDQTAYVSAQYLEAVVDGGDTSGGATAAVSSTSMKIQAACFYSRTGTRTEALGAEWIPWPSVRP